MPQENYWEIEGADPEVDTYGNSDITIINGFETSTGYNGGTARKGTNRNDRMRAAGTPLDSVGASNFAFECMFKVDATSSLDRYIVADWEQVFDNDRGWHLAFSKTGAGGAGGGDKLWIRCTEDGTSGTEVGATGSDIVGLGWQHLLLSRIGSNMTLYKNGAPNAVISNVPATIFSGVLTYIGNNASWSPGPGFGIVDCHIDKIGTFNTGLTAAQAYARYLEVTGGTVSQSLWSGRTADTKRPNGNLYKYLQHNDAAASFPLWEMDGQDPRDCVAVGGDPTSLGPRQLTVVGTPSVNSAGQFGEALDFDGSNDYLTHTGHADFRQSGALTVAAWVYADSLSGSHVVASCAGDADATEAKNTLWEASVESDGSLKLFWEEGAGVDYSRSSSVDLITESAWWFFVITRSASGVVKFYYGNNTTAMVLDSTSAATTMPSGGGSSRFAIAAAARAYANKWQGSLNGVWIAGSEGDSDLVDFLRTNSIRQACAVVV